MYLSLYLYIRWGEKDLFLCKMLALKFTIFQCQKGQNEAQRKSKGLQGRECLWHLPVLPYQPASEGWSVLWKSTSHKSQNPYDYI